jgi:spore coat protein U-like protein
VKRTPMLAALMLCLMPGLAQAASCTVSATAVAFGAFNPFGAVVNSTGTVSVTCSGGGINNTYTIALSTGSGTYAQRYMNSLLKYNLYSDSTHMTIWGDGTGGSSTVTGTNGHTTNNFTVYGQIPTPQGIAPNNYSDSITVTVTY